MDGPNRGEVKHPEAFREFQTPHAIPPRPRSPGRWMWSASCVNNIPALDFPYFIPLPSSLMSLVSPDLHTAVCTWCVQYDAVAFHADSRPIYTAARNTFTRVVWTVNTFFTGRPTDRTRTRAWVYYEGGAIDKTCCCCTIRRGVEGQSWISLVRHKWQHTW